MNSRIDPIDESGSSDVDWDRVWAATGKGRSPRDDSDNCELRERINFDFKWIWEVLSLLIEMVMICEVLKDKKLTEPLTWATAGPPESLKNKF